MRRDVVDLQPGGSRAPIGRGLVVPGLDGDPRLLMGAAPRLFPGLRALPFDHFRGSAEDGVEGLAERALARRDHLPDLHPDWHSGSGRADWRGA